MEIIRWGILGCGRIARKFAADLNHVLDAKLTAVGARELENAKAFANEFPVSHVHGSYEDLVSDRDVDVIETPFQRCGKFVNPLIARVCCRDDVEAGPGPDHVVVGQLGDRDGLVRQDRHQRVLHVRHAARDFLEAQQRPRSHRHHRRRRNEIVRLRPLGDDAGNGFGVGLA